MGYYDPQPESFGFKHLIDLQWGEPDYDFCITAVYQSKEGFHVVTDSGCSCPSPFEDYNKPEDFGPAVSKRDAIAELVSDLVRYLKDGYGTEKEKLEAAVDITDMIRFLNDMKD
jgi:hypothetical protein